MTPKQEEQIIKHGENLKKLFRLSAGEKTYSQRVQELEEEGMTTSDAQGVADAEIIKGAKYPDKVAEKNAVVWRT